MFRYYEKYISKYKSKKISLLSGPRQAGKTTISQRISRDYDYLNYDSEEDREIIREKSWDRNKSEIIFDEIHKKKNWKQWLKGIYDTEGNTPNIIVTGSARIDTYKKMGDSLAGRYFEYRIHPLDLSELYKVDKKIDVSEVLERLLMLGGFPEPYLENDLGFYNKWKKTHLDIILRQDLIDSNSVSDIKSIEILVSLLQKRVSSPLSYLSLARDLDVSDKTVKRWIQVLSESYVIFILYPWHKNIARAVKKQPKLYFFDNPRVLGDEGTRLENLVANSLIKEVEFKNDCHGRELSLHYVARQGGVEIDFAIVENDELQYLIEVKTSDDKPSKSFNLFREIPSSVKKIQLVKKLKREKTFPSGVEIRDLAHWLAKIDL